MFELSEIRALRRLCSILWKKLVLLYEVQENTVRKRSREETRKISFASQPRSRECTLEGHMNSATKNRGERYDTSRVDVSVESETASIFVGEMLELDGVRMTDMPVSTVRRCRNRKTSSWVYASNIPSSCQPTPPPGTASGKGVEVATRWGSGRGNISRRFRKWRIPAWYNMRAIVRNNINGCFKTCFITFRVISGNANVVWRLATSLSLPTDGRSWAGIRDDGPGSTELVESGSA